MFSHHYRTTDGFDDKLIDKGSKGMIRNDEIGNNNIRKCLQMIRNVNIEYNTSIEEKYDLLYNSKLSENKISSSIGKSIFHSINEMKEILQSDIMTKMYGNHDNKNIKEFVSEFVNKLVIGEQSEMIVVLSSDVFCYIAVELQFKHNIKSNNKRKIKANMIAFVLKY